MTDEFGDEPQHDHLGTAPEPVAGSGDDASGPVPLHPTDGRTDTVLVSTRHRGHRARERRGRGKGCLAVLLVVVVLVAGIAFGGERGYHFLKDHLQHASDYSGPGYGSVLFRVHSGDSVAQIGRDLKAAGVVESVDAFISAAGSNSKAEDIQAGYYRLKHHMSSADAVGVLTDPANLIRDEVLVTPGERTADVVTDIVAKTKITRKAVVAALADGKAIGLPAQADGNPEGYLWPATYDVQPGETAVQLIKEMVAGAVREDQHLGLAAGAAKLHLSEQQLVTVASILEYEAKRKPDYPKVARAIYNRLRIGMALQSDATVAYANHLHGEVWTTQAQRDNPSPYNTYQHTGLPPGPIGNPGAATLEAAMHPAHGAWLYWVVVNLATGKTIFSDTYAEHEQAVKQLDQYCSHSKAC